MRPLIIEVAMNELMAKASNPHVPYGPEEVSIDAAACVEAGAAMLHFHARDAQTGDQLWTSTETYVDAMRRIFALGVARDVLFYPTYEWLTEEKLTHVFALRKHPDVRLALAALDVGAVLLNSFDAATSTFERADWGKVFTHEQTVWFLQMCRSHGLRPYSGCAEPGHLRHLLAYRDMGLLDAPLVLKFFTAEHAPYGLPPGAKSVHTYAGLLDELLGDSERVWFVHCYGAAILPMAQEAIALGGHVRIGLGDETFEDSKPTNAELVGRVALMARAVGRRVATPLEAREMMGLEA